MLESQEKLLIQRTIKIDEPFVSTRLYIGYMFMVKCHQLFFQIQQISWIFVINQVPSIDLVTKRLHGVPQHG